MKMSNKKQEQIAAKSEHKEKIRAAKAKRRGEPILERAEPVKIEKPVILIVCEGRNTEPSYFRQFKLASAHIKAVGDGNNTVSLVNQAIQLNTAGKYEQVWCVFDKDDFSANDFNNAIAMATAQGFLVAYSNQSFEYWLILHFEDHQGGAMNRSDYEGKINRYINPLDANYDGTDSKIITDDFFELLNAKDEQTGQFRYQLAIQRAERNYNQWDHASPANEESTTTVFKIVEEILKYSNLT